MFLTLVTFIILLSLLVFVHELGHFVSARKFGARVEEFGFGLPPRIFGIYKSEGKWRFIWGKKSIEQINQTVYSLNWIPVGGFVKIKGENGEGKENDDSFASKPIWQRALILSSGVLMNLILTIILIAVGFGIGMPAVIDSDIDGAIIEERSVQIVRIMKDLPAEKAGLQVGDEIVSIDENYIKQSLDLRNILSDKAGGTVVLSYKRDDKINETEISVVDYNESVGIGIAIVDVGIVRYPWYLTLWQGIKTTFIWLGVIIVAFYNLIKNLIISQPVGLEVVGPVGIAAMTGQAARAGIVYVLQFAALLSINLAIINYLPIPALDGGRVLFLIIEKVRGGKPVKQEWENLAHNIGFILLMFLVLVLTFRDLGEYGGRVVNIMKNLF